MNRNNERTPPVENGKCFGIVYIEVCLSQELTKNLLCDGVLSLLEGAKELRNVTVVTDD